MRIGIITYWDTEDNYGQVLQCYALIKCLESLGHHAFLVKTRKTAGPRRGFLRKLFTLFYLLSRPKNIINLFKKKADKESETRFTPVIDRGFTLFREKYLPSTDAIYTYDDLLTRPLDVDMMICGSDQIWSAISPMMFLHFPGSFKRVSYAASFGGFKINNKLDRNEVKRWLEAFDFISVRERDGVDICNELGLKAEVFPDPTLLLDSKAYESLMVDSISEDETPYILLYLLGNPIDVDVRSIFDLANNTNLTIRYVASQGRIDDYDKIYPKMAEWLALVKNARAVITNSFHGTVFSLIFNTPFMTIPLSGNVTRMNGRIIDLLSKYNLEDRLYSGNLNSVFDDIDFTSFNTIKEKDRIYVVNRLTRLF